MTTYPPELIDGTALETVFDIRTLNIAHIKALTELEKLSASGKYDAYACAFVCENREFDVISREFDYFEDIRRVNGAKIRMITNGIYGPEQDSYNFFSVRGRWTHFTLDIDADEKIAFNAIIFSDKMLCKILKTTIITLPPYRYAWGAVYALNSVIPDLSENGFTVMRYATSLRRPALSLINL